MILATALPFVQCYKKKRENAWKAEQKWTAWGGWDRRRKGRGKGNGMGQYSTHADITSFLGKLLMAWTVVFDTGADSIGHGGTCPHFYNWLGTGHA